MKSILFLIDKCICKYIGINQQEIRPQYIRKDKNNITLVNTETHKRHLHAQNWIDFDENQLEALSDTAKQRLGISLGKVIAKNLVISFDKTTIIKE